MYRLKKLPYKKEFNSIEIYQYLSDANFCIGELKGLLESTQYLSIILKYICLFEAKDSADIENIQTDFLSIFIDSIAHKKTKTNSEQVITQLKAINKIYQTLTNKNILEIDDINNIQQLLVPNQFGVRKVRGHKIYNKLTNKVLYIPPQNEHAILEYYQNLVNYINTQKSKYDPLIKMAIIHYQFICIHPYEDGNGRIGRIINVLSLIICKRLKYPILNLSNFFYSHRKEYFYLLEKCHNDFNYLDEFIIFVLKGITETSNYTITLVHNINKLIAFAKNELKLKCHKIYSEKLLEHLFMYPCTKNKYLRNDLQLSRSTSSKYLNTLVNIGFLNREKHGKEIIYTNKLAINLFQNKKQT